MKSLNDRSFLSSRVRQIVIGLVGYAAMSGAASATCLEHGPSNTGGISTESSSFFNHCNTHVAFTYCIEGYDKDGLFECSRQKFGAGSVAPNRREVFSIMGAEGRRYRIYWVECESDVAHASFPLKARFTGNGIRAECN